MRRPVYRSTFKPRSLRHSESRAKRKLIITVVVILVISYVFFMWVLPFLIGQLSFLNKKNTTVDAESLKIDEAIAPPVLYIPYEATNSASLEFSGYAAPLSRVELYIDGEIKTQTNTNSEGKFTTPAVDLNLGTNNITGVTISDSDKKSLPSKNIRLYYSNEKPKLEVTEPADGTNITGDKKVKVSGKTDANNSVTVNGSTVIVDGEGNFSTIIPLNDGENTLVIKTSNTFGNSQETTRKVNYASSDASPSPSPSANP